MKERLFTKKISQKELKKTIISNSLFVILIASLFVFLGVKYDSKLLIGALFIIVGFFIRLGRYLAYRRKDGYNKILMIAILLSLGIAFLIYQF